MNTYAEPAQFVKSVGRLLNAVYNGLPEGDVVIEDMVIKGDKVLVKYKSAVAPVESLTEKLSGKAINVSSLNVLGLGSGDVLEKWNPVYQVKTQYM